MTSERPRVDVARSVRALSAGCPKCGAPCPIVLSLPARITCEACRYSGEPSAEVSHAIVAAHQALQNLDLKQRQLSASERILVLAPGQAGRVLGWWLASGIPVLLAFLVGLAALLSAMGQDDGINAKLDLPVVLYTVVPPTWLPFATFVAFGVALRKTLALRAGELSRALWARPPAAGQHQFSCRYCGALLQDEMGVKVVRCSHCASDNLVREDVSREAMTLELDAFSDYEAKVSVSAFEQRKQVTRRILVALVAPSILLAVAIPVAVIAHSVLERSERPVSEDHLHYVRMAPRTAPYAREATACIGYRDADSSGDRIVSRGDTAVCIGTCRVVPTNAADPERGLLDETMFTPVVLRDLAGRSGECHEIGPCVVERVVSDGFGRDWLVLGSGDGRRVRPETMCLYASERR